MLREDTFKEFPDYGTFTRRTLVKTGSLSDYYNEEEVLLATECDVHPTQITDKNGVVFFGFKVFMPIPKKNANIIRYHDDDLFFDGGLVIDFEESQLGYWTVTVKDAKR